MRPLLHAEDLPASVLANNWHELPDLGEKRENCTEGLSTSSDPSFMPQSSQEYHLA
jgi:hypothetical protein